MCSSRVSGRIGFWRGRVDVSVRGVGRVVIGVRQRLGVQEKVVVGLVLGVGIGLVIA